ncbi:L-fucose:H+ symporter permease [Pedobacter sp. KBW01]|uniref:L-fucose:H+ symporter permease n=1 Tax=Pedobacter sp. KBW01 TaxID=2153364 RepID=UPI000F599D66|nr:L-fucose:H+ symporter permease [Pedobacter sp. KBW01]RQO66647.1 L-fucose:H+ symporter permease [Pedobacter sp. KBW01]
MIQTNKQQFAFVLITSLFFLWGFALNLNPILIPHLKKACQLTDSQSALIDSASYIAYFLLAIPAGKFMQKYGYKGGIIVGLLLFAAGAFLFYPAAVSRQYGFFLFAIFVIASGLTFLETAANPYITILGNPATATQRLNFAQSFNGLAAFMAPLLGGIFILSGKTLSKAQEKAMSLPELNDYLDHEASSVRLPFILIGIVVSLIVILLWKTRLPDIKEQDNELIKEGSILKEKNLLIGVMAQFFYVGAQVCVSSFFIRFSERVAGIEEKSAAYFLSGALLGFMIGRFVGTALMRFVRPAKLLALYSVFNILLLSTAALATGKTAVYALIGVEFFMSIMFPTIFSLAILGLGGKTKQGSSLLIMSIVSGAIFPVIMGAVSDASNIQTAYLVPASCFTVIFYFAIKNLNAGKTTLSTSH